jgi:hypothetical protein
LVVCDNDTKNKSTFLVLAIVTIPYNKYITGVTINYFSSSVIVIINSNKDNELTISSVITQDGLNEIKDTRTSTNKTRIIK